MPTSLSTTDVPLAGPGEGEENGNWKRTMEPRKNSGTRSVYAIGKRKWGRGSGKANRERVWGTASLNWTKELKRGAE